MAALSKHLLEHLAEARLAEARCLLDSGYFSGAFYLGGYAAELGLKACIAGTFQPGVIPAKRRVERIYTHDLQALIELAELDADFTIKVRTERQFAAFWEIVRGWSEAARYDIVDEPTARGLIEALRDPQHGVFEWIRSYW